MTQVTHAQCVLLIGPIEVVVALFELYFGSFRIRIAKDGSRKQFYPLRLMEARILAGRDGSQNALARTDATDGGERHSHL
jgi:hypothetical protein